MFISHAGSTLPLRPRLRFLRGGAALFALAALFTLAACGQDGITTRPGTSGGSGGAGGSDGSGGGASTSTSSGAGGSGGDGAVGMPVSIADWNTHNFFNDKNDDANPSEFFVSAADYAQKRVDVATVIVKLNADIAVLQEVENQSVLDDLNASIKLEGGESYPYTSLTPTYDTREIAILSRIPIDKVVSHQTEYFKVKGLVGGQQYKYTRDCIEVHMTVNGRELVLLGVHFRSKVAPDDPDKRLAEAQHTRDIADAILKATPDAALVILGDYNDTPDSLPVKAVIGAGPAFTDVASLVPKATQWSFNFMGSQELIDHQIANPLLFGMVDPAAVSIMHSAAVDTASDHSPIMATYYVK